MLTTVILSHTIDFISTKKCIKKAVIKSMITAFFKPFKGLFVNYKRAAKS